VRLIPVEEYLSTFYRPDRDYLDGRLEERNAREWNHALLQTALLIYLNANGTRSA
jgi:hypothetical protein